MLGWDGFVFIFESWVMSGLADEVIFFRKSRYDDVSVFVEFVLRHPILAKMLELLFVSFEGSDRAGVLLYQFHQYQVVGRALPTATNENPKAYRMKLWATDEVRAKSKFWYVCFTK